MEQVAEAVKIVLLSCISDRIFDQTVNAVQPFVVPKTSSHDRILRGTVEHISRCSSAADDRTIW